MISDPIADFLIRIKNASMIGRRATSVPHSKAKEALAKILQAEGYLDKVEVVGKNAKKELVLTIAANKVKPKTIKVKRISKPGRRVYTGTRKIDSLRRGLGIVIISTPKGLMTGKEALAKNLGGEVLCKIV